MKWVSAISTAASLDVAIRQVTNEIRARLGDLSAHLLVVFAAGAHGGPHVPALSLLPSRLCAAFPGARLVGCSGGGIAGGGQEVEEGPALALLAAHLPDVAIEALHLESLPSAEAPPEVWREQVGLEPEHQPLFLLLPDPFSVDLPSLLAGLDRSYPGAPKLGGIASGGGSRPGTCALFLDEQVLNRGTVLLALYGDIHMDTVVAQGCRPIGAPLTVTEADRNLILSLGGEGVLPTLEALFSGLSPRDQALFRRAPMLGIAMNPDKTRPLPGDFLVRDIQGIARPSGALAVAARVEPGMVVQFHVRDPAAAAMELRELLTHHKRQHLQTPPAGALLFTCLGRGARFFGTPHHDTLALQDALGPVPLGGFFCSGEIGPVHGQTFLHGYTSAVGLLRPQGWS